MVISLMWIGASLQKNLDEIRFPTKHHGQMKGCVALQKSRADIRPGLQHSLQFRDASLDKEIE